MTNHSDDPLGAIREHIRLLKEQVELQNTMIHTLETSISLLSAQKQALYSILEAISKQNCLPETTQKLVEVMLLEASFNRPSPPDRK